MPRPNLGPRLILRRQADGRRPLYHIRWTEFGRTRWTSAHTDDPETAKRFFEDWLDAQRRARRRVDGDPAAVGIADLLIDYHTEHTGELAAPEALRFALPPLLAFFAADTVAGASQGVLGLAAPAFRRADSGRGGHCRDCRARRR